MTNKNFGWHKAWGRLPNGRLRHVSGLEYTVKRGDGFTDINTVDNTLQEYQDFELARGVAPHQMVERILRLNKEAVRWHEANP